MKNLRIAAACVLVTAACLLAVALAYDATLPTVALGLPAAGGEAAVAVGGFCAALAVFACGLRELQRAGHAPA